MPQEFLESKTPADGDSPYEPTPDEKFWLQSLQEIENFAKSHDYKLTLQLAGAGPILPFRACLQDDVSGAAEKFYILRHADKYDKRWICKCVVESQPEQSSKTVGARSLKSAINAADSSFQ